MLKVEVSYRGLVAVGLAALSFWAMFRLWPILLLVITAFIFMTALLPFVDWLCRKGFPRVVAVLVVLLIVLSVVGGLVAIVVPAMIGEFRQLKDNLPEDARKLEDFASDLGFNTKNWNLEERAAEIKWTELVSGRAALNYGQRVAAGFLSTFTVIILTAYLLVDTARLRAFLFRFVPPAREPEVHHFLKALNRVVGGFVRGQLITSVAIGLYTTLVLLIVGVDRPLAFGVIAAFADIIPLVGAFIAIIPATLAAFQESPTQALIVVGALLVYQQFEDRFLVPRVYGQTLNLPALVVMLAVLVGGELLGIVGVLLALPAAAAARVFLDYYLDGRRGVETVEAPPGELFAPDESPGVTPG